MQLVQLQQAKSQFEALGYGVAALSYDSREILDDFAKRKAIDYPLLSDPQSQWLREAGLLNTEADGLLKGTSLPATLVVEPDGTVSHIYRESAYQDRITPSTLLEILAGAEPPPAENSPPPARPAVSQGQTETQVTAGSLFSVTAQLSLPKGWHVYAPGNETYIPVSLEFAPHPLLEIVGVDFPEPEHLKLMDEDVAVYEGRLTVHARVKVKSGKDIRDQLPELSQSPLEATLGYQCCTEESCFPPAEAKLRWTFHFLPLDLERSPEAIQHKE